MHTQESKLFHFTISSAYNIPRTTIPTPPSAAAATIGMLVGAAMPSELSVAEETAFPALSVAELRALDALLEAAASPLDAEPAAAVIELYALLAEEAASPVAVANWLDRDDWAAAAADCAA